MRPGAFWAVLALLAVVPARAESCNTVDAFAPAMDVAVATAGQPAGAQVAEFDAKVIDRFPALYQDGVIGVGPGPERDAKIVVSLDKIRFGTPVDAAKASVIDSLSGISALYAKTFPDFRCDFPIYLMDSLGQLDGAGRIVAGRRALVIGIDVLATEDPSLRPVFLAHEFFHRYHEQAAGFSDDAGQGQALWRVLWAEGLATYVSLRLTPGATLAQALILPADLEARSKPQMARIVGLLQPHLDDVDAVTYRLLFTYGGKDAAAAGLPWRSGYYLGYRVAAELGRTRSPRVLAHLRGPRLRKLIGATLTKLAAEG